jgi:hypothetical protein
MPSAAANSAFRAKNARLFHGKPLYEVRSYTELVRALDMHRVRAGFRHLEMDEKAGVPHGYYGKVACGIRNYGIVSLGLVLAVLGLKIILVPDED